MSRNRNTPSDNNQLILFNQVDWICPVCFSTLIYEKNQKKYKKYEIAHIYPLNITEEEKVVLKDVEKLNEDLNHIDNLICLCKDCHTKFDKPRTLNEYNEMVERKKVLIRKWREKEFSESKLEQNLIDLIDFLSNSWAVIDLEFNKLTYNPKTIDKKMEFNDNSLLKNKIKYNVGNYFLLIKAKFKEKEQINPLITDKISLQIKSFYLEMLEIHQWSQSEIFNAIVDWISKKSWLDSSEASEIMVSYFIQNCEIF